MESEEHTSAQNRGAPEGPTQLALVGALTEGGFPLRFPVYGSSMQPFIRDGDVVTVAPLAGRPPTTGEVVAFRSAAGNQLVLHRVVGRAGVAWVLRGDGRTQSDEPVQTGDILGRVVRVERDGREVHLGTGRTGALVAWLSRTGGLKAIGSARIKLRQTGGLVVGQAQGSALYRGAARRLAPRVEICKVVAGGARLPRWCTDRVATDRVADESALGAVPGAERQEWVAKHGQNVVALAELTIVRDADSPWHGCWLSSEFVRLPYRGMGIGQALARRLMDEARGQGWPDVAVLVPAGDARAFDMFRKWGLRPVSNAAWVMSPELRALIACAAAVIDERRRDEARELVLACPDPERLCEAALTQGVLGHLYMLSRAVPLPAALSERLAELHRPAAQRCLRQTAQLVRIVKQLNAAGVKVLVYKGPVWAQTLYGDVTLRTWADLDLLVNHDDLATTRQVLLSHGFVDASLFNVESMKRKRANWGELEFSHPEHGWLVEAHWEVREGLGAKPLPGERLLARAVEVKLLGRSVLAPSETDAFLIDCVHGSKHWWDNVERLLGLGIRITRVPSAGWAGLVAAARDAGCARRLTVGVAHACRVFDLPVPPEIADMLARDRIGRYLLGSLGPSSMDRSLPLTAQRDLVTMGRRVIMEDSAAATFRHALIRTFRPGEEDWESASLPNGLRWLHYLLRPGRLAVKWARRLVH